MRRGSIVLLLVVVSAGCSSGSPAATRHASATTRPPTAVIARGRLLGWYPMAYLASNPTFVPIEMQTQAPAAVTVGSSASIVVNAYPLADPVWVSIQPARVTVHAREGAGVLDISTGGCPVKGACDPRPLYALTGTPIPPAPPGGVVTRQGFVLHVTTTAAQPGRYDLTLPIRYPASDAHPARLDTFDTLHVRIAVYAQGPPATDCTPNDLRRPTTAPPAAHILKDTIALEGGSTRLDPPPRGFRPRVSPSRARRLLTSGRGPGGGGEATLVLAALSEMQSGTLPRLPKLPAGGGLRATPKLALRPHDVVAWVLYTQHVAVNDNLIITPAPRPGSPTTPPNACFFSDGISAVNATTGAQMDSRGGSASPDMIQF